MLACELPIILSVIGFGTFGAYAIEIKPPLWMEMVGVTSAILGSLILIGILVRLIRRRRLKASAM